MLNQSHFQCLANWRSITRLQRIYRRSICSSLFTCCDVRVLFAIFLPFACHRMTAYDSATPPVGHNINPPSGFPPISPPSPPVCHRSSQPPRCRSIGKTETSLAHLLRPTIFILRVFPPLPLPRKFRAPHQLLLPAASGPYQLPLKGLPVFGFTH